MLWLLLLLVFGSQLLEVLVGAGIELWLNLDWLALRRFALDLSEEKRSKGSAR